MRQLKTYKGMVGKTIQSIEQLQRKTTDDEGFLKINFTDNTFVVIVAYYGGYTGNSEDEYPTYIGIQRQLNDDLIINEIHK